MSKSSRQWKGVVERGLKQAVEEFNTLFGTTDIVTLSAIVLLLAGSVLRLAFKGASL